jgi:hypothetical protein
LAAFESELSAADSMDLMIVWLAKLATSDVTLFTTRFSESSNLGFQHHHVIQFSVFWAASNIPNTMLCLQVQDSGKSSSVTGVSIR